MVDIIATTLNPSIDILTSVPRVEPGHKLRCTSPLVYPGGGAVNVARMARLCGANVELICAAGGAAGTTGLAFGCGRDFMGTNFRGGETREDLTVIDAETADEYRIHFSWPNTAAIGMGGSVRGRTQRSNCRFCGSEVEVCQQRCRTIITQRSRTSLLRSALNLYWIRRACP